MPQDSIHSDTYSNLEIKVPLGNGEHVTFVTKSTKGGALQIESSPFTHSAWLDAGATQINPNEENVKAFFLRSGSMDCNVLGMINVSESGKKQQTASADQAKKKKGGKK